MPPPISDYALIGDGRSSALVSKAGSVDFLCLPHFDSDACFAALLGQKRDGCWRLAPAGYVRKVERRYRGDTLVLETDWETEGGAVRLVDFMSWGAPEPVLVRIAEGLKGEVELESLVRLRFDYGRTPAWIEASGQKAGANAGPHQVVLHAPARLRARRGYLYSRYRAQGRAAALFTLLWTFPRPCSDETGRGSAVGRNGAGLGRVDRALRQAFSLGRANPALTPDLASAGGPHQRRPGCGS